MEVSLEDRLRHQHQARLNHPISNGRNPQRPVLARRLRNLALLDRRRHELARLHVLTQISQEVLPSVVGLDRADRQPVDPGRACPGVPGNPLPRHA